MKPITIERLYKQLQQEIKKGHGDYIIFVTDDEEGNGYHALWYDGCVAKEVDDREYIEELNCDLVCCKENKDKAFYIG